MNRSVVKAADRFEDTRIAAVSDGSDYWEIKRADGWEFGIAKKYGVEPRVGDCARFYGDGIGSPVRGVDLNGVEVYYETAAEYQARTGAEWAERKAEQKRRYFAEEAEKSRARIERLPTPFVQRLNGFWQRNPEFWEHEGYELFVCEQAVLIADTLKTTEAVHAFHQRTDWAAQVADVPGLDDGHSGNTFGAACQFAQFYLERPEIIPELHGALCPLVGCTSYGCWAVSQTPAT